MFDLNTQQADVSIIACTKNGVELYYAKDISGVKRIQSGPVKPDEAEYSLSDGMMSCRFTYDNSAAKQNSNEV